MTEEETIRCPNCWSHRKDYHIQRCWVCNGKGDATLKEMVEYLLHKVEILESEVSELRGR